MSKVEHRRVPDELRIRYVKRGWKYVRLFEQKWEKVHCGEVIETYWQHIPVEDPRDYER